MLDLLLPPRCPICRAFLNLSDGIVCATCDAFLEPTAVDRDGVGSIAVLGRHAGELRRAVHQLKFRGEAWRGRPLGARLAESAAERGFVFARGVVVVPVASSASHARLRGFNPAREIASGFARRAGLRCAPRALRRVREGPPQAELDATQRQAVTGAFTSSAPGGEMVVLVDDVVTTGATLAACAGALREAGAGRIRCVALAHAVLRTDGAPETREMR